MRENDINFQPDELGGELGKAFAPPLRPAIFDRDVVPFDKTGLIQALVERSQVVRKSFAGSSVEEPDHRHRRLLRARRERPHSCPAAKQRDELATAAHSITSSARPESGSGTVMPSTLAAF